jgi:TIR domain
MPTRNPTIPEHIFISFSRDDKVIAEQIIDALHRKDIPTWIDYSKLTPGTPDWEAAIRAAIDKSFAVVMLASPQSRASKYVRGELSLAESKGHQIYPLWIDGAEWSDCIPLGMTYAQFIDARGEKQENGIAELCGVLEQQIQSATPKHYLVSPLRRRVKTPWGGVADLIDQVSPPPGFASIELTEDDEPEWEEDGSAVFMRTSDYSSIHAFLDDLYLGYLTDTFKPFTYGLIWILEEYSGFSPCHVLLPWSWLLKQQSSSEMESQWLHNTPLSDCWLLPRTSWRIRRIAKVKPRGLAVNDERIIQAIRIPKAEYFLRAEGVLLDQPISEVGSNYRFRCVISGHQFFGKPSPPGTAMVQSDKPLPEDFIKYWLDRL